MSHSSEELAELVGLFYQAAFDPARWPEAASRLARWFEANVAGIMLPPTFDDGPPMLVNTIGVPDNAQQDYLVEYHRHDLLTQAAFRRPGRIVTSDEVTAGIDFTRHIFWNEFSRPHTGAWHGMASSVGGGPGMMIVTRERGQDDFAGRETAEFRLLLQQLGGAMALGQRVAAERLRSVAFDALGLPALIVDPRARLLHANPAAQALSARRGVAMVRHRMALPDIAERQRFVSLVAAACRGIGGGMPLALSDGKGPLRLRTAPLPAMLRPPGMAGESETAALVTLRDLEPAPVAAGLLLETLGLTKAEAEVAALLSQGLSGVDVARRRGVGQETVRTQIEAIQGKAGARNLRELTLRLGRLGED